MEINSDLGLAIGILALAIVSIFLIKRRLEIFRQVANQDQDSRIKDQIQVIKNSPRFALILAMLSITEVYLTKPSLMIFLKWFALGILWSFFVPLFYLTRKSIFRVLFLLFFGLSLFMLKIFHDDVNMFAAVVYSGLGSFLVITLFRKKLLTLIHG